MLAGIDYREDNRWFGTHNENQGLAQWRYTDGVYGLAATGEGEGMGADFTGCYLRLVGSDGVVEVGVEDGPALRYRVDGSGWTEVDTGDSIHGPSEGLVRAGLRRMLEKAPVLDGARLRTPSFYERAIEEVVTALREDREPIISGRRSLNGPRLAFGAWESVRSRGRVEFPLDIEDNPLKAMLEAGVFDVGSRD
jgi:predicted dehydrogenase